MRYFHCKNELLREKYKHLIGTTVKTMHDVIIFTGRGVKMRYYYCTKHHSMFEELLRALTLCILNYWLHELMCMCAHTCVWGGGICMCVLCSITS